MKPDGCVLWLLYVREWDNAQMPFLQEARLRKDREEPRSSAAFKVRDMWNS